MANSYEDLFDQEFGGEAKPAGPSNPYEALVDDDRQAQKTMVQGAMFVAEKEDPEKKAKALKLSQKINLPVEVVERNIEAIEAQVNQRSFDYDAIVDSTPGLAKFLEDPTNATLAKDDFDALTSADKSLQMFRPGKKQSYLDDVKRAGSTGLNQLSGSTYHLAAAYGLVDPAVAAEAVAHHNKRAQELQKDLPDYKVAFDEAMKKEGGDLNKASKEFIKSYENLRKEKVSKALKDFAINGTKTAGEALDMVWAAGKHPRGLVYSTVEQLSNSFPGLVAGGAAGAAGAAAGTAVAPGVGTAIGGASGFVAGSFAGEYATEVGAWVNEAMHQRGIDTTDPEQILQAYRDPKLMQDIRKEAERKGLGTAATGALFNMFGGALSRGARGAVSKAVRGAGDVGVQMVGEAAGEAAGQAAVYEGDLSKVDWAEVAQEGIISAGHAVGETAISPLAKGARAAASKFNRESLAKDPIEAASELSEQHRAAADAIRDAKSLDQAAEAIKGAKLSERSPEKVREFVENVLGGDDSTSTVFFQLDDWDNFWNKKGLSPVKAAEDIFGQGAKSYATAKETGAMLEVPAADFISKVAPTDNWGGLLPFVRTSIDAKSLIEARERNRALPLMMEQIAKEAEGIDQDIQAQSQARDESAARVADNVTEQLRSSGFDQKTAKTYSALYESFFRSVAERAGVTPEELFNRYNLGINQLGGPAENDGQTVMNQARRGVLFPVRQQGENNFLVDPLEQVKLSGSLMGQDFQIINQAFDSTYLGPATDALRSIVAHAHAMGAKTVSTQFTDPQLAELYEAQGFKISKKDGDLYLANKDLAIGDGAAYNGPYEQEETWAGHLAPDASRREARGSSGPQTPTRALRALPKSSPGPIAAIQHAAAAYQRQAGLEPRSPTYHVKADPRRGARIAQAFEAMKHDPNNAQVKAAYKAMIEETLAQYQFVKKLGLKVEVITSDMANPYPDGPKQVLEDIRQGHLWLFPTELGFGSINPVNDNPMLQPTQEKIGDYTLLANDVFRIVHDVFGHAKEGVGFGPSGEENAWQAHVRMYSPLAARAMTTETRGQNSWVNFGPHGEQNQGNQNETIYADQKVGLLPEWVMREGMAPDQQVLFQSANPNQSHVPTPQISQLGFYSKIEELVLQKMGGSATVEQVKALLKDVKEEERKWSGIDDFLREKKKVSKAEVLAFLRANQVEIVEVTRQDREGSIEVGAEVWTIFSKDGEGGDTYLDYDEAKRAAEADYGEDNYDIQRMEWDGETSIVDVEHHPQSFGLTKFSRYTLPGGENYREVLLTMQPKEVEFTEADLPAGYSLREVTDKPFYNWVIDGPEDSRIDVREETKDDALRSFAKQYNSREEFSSSHFDEKNILAHVRLNDRVDADGKRVLFVEEIQSDWHQAGRKKGYRGDEAPFDQAEYSKLSDKINVEAHKLKAQLIEENGKLEARLDDIEGRLSASLRDPSKHPSDEEMQERQQIRKQLVENSKLLDGRDTSGELVKRGMLTEQERSRMIELNDLKYEMAATSKVPDAPFRKTWHEFALKRVIRMAAEGGYDRVAWTTGEQQAERYDLSKQIDEINYGNIKGENAVWLRIYDKRANLLPLDRQGFAVHKTFDDENATTYKVPKDQLEDVVGKEIAERILKGEGKRGNKGGKSLTDTGLKVGGEGMKGFYDKILVDFANKFGKKYGAKVGESKIPGGELSSLEVSRDRETDRYAIITPNGNIYSDALGGEYFGYESQDEANEVLSTLRSNGDKVHSLDITPELKDAAISKGFTLFQKREDGPRGAIRIDAARRFNIDLYASADLSTFLHETGHFYLEILADLATAPNASDQLQSDFKVLLDWFGVESRDQIETKHHEMLARAFEAYLMEGKAPSSRLQKVFSRIKVWLLSVYRQIRNLNVELTPDVRGVFDRMLATEDEIQQVWADQNFDPLFKDPRSMGFSEAKAEAYEAATAEAKQAAEDAVRARAMKEFNRQKEKWFKEERAQVKARIEAEANGMRIYRALSILQKGVLPDGSSLPEGMQPFKLDRSEIAKGYGEQFLKRLPKPYVYAKDGGLHPDVAAELLGYESGDALLTELANSVPKKEFIEKAADVAMAQKYPEMWTDGSLKEVVTEALHNADRRKMLRMELEHLAANNMPVLKEAIRKVARRVPSDEAVRKHAKRLIGQKLVSDLKPYVFQRAERKAAKEAGEKLAAGDLEGAFEAKSRELLNYELYLAAVEAKETVSKSLKNWKRIFKPDDGLAKSRDMDLVNAARAVLSSYGLGRTDKTAMEYLDPIRRYDPEVYQTIEALVASAAPAAAPYKTVAFDDFIAMKDAVDALWDLSKTSREIDINGIKMDREEVRLELEQRLAVVTEPGARPGYEKAVERWDKVKMGLLGVRAALTRAEAWCDAVDGDDKKVFTRYFYEPVARATSDYRLAKKKYLEKYLEIVKPIEKSLTFKEIKAPEINYSFSGKAELLGALLHTGNESNLSKLLRGRDWGRDLGDAGVDRSQWQQFINRMYREGVVTKADMDFVQAVWDLNEELKPQAQKVHKRLYGHYFNEVTADAVETPFGVYRGGYMPAIVDPFIAQDAAIRSEKEMLEKNNNSFMFPTAGRGFTKSRVEQYAAPLAMDLRMVPMHLDKVLRFVHIEPTTKAIGRIVMDKSFRKSLDAFDPTIGGDMLVPWLQRVAQQRVSQSTQGWGGKALDTFFRELRTRTGLQVMTANVTNTLQQFTGLSIAAIKVKPRLLRNALWTYMKSPSKTTEMIVEKSDFMKTRVTAQTMEVQQTIDDMLLNPTKYEKARDFAKKHGYFLQSATQNIVDVIVWTGAYEQAIEGRASEDNAVAAADAAVRLTQGSFNAEDVSRFETGTPFMRAFTMFYSYFNMQANLLGSEFLKTMRSLGLKKGAGRLMYVYVFGFMIPAFLSEMLVRAMSGKIDEDDDDEYLDDVMSAFFNSQFRSASAMFPVVGPAANAGVNAFNDKWYDDRISTSPAISMVESSVSAPHSVYSAISGDGSKKRAVRDTLSLMGLMTGMPLAPLSRPAGYLVDVSEGKADPSGPVDFTRGLVTGKAGN